MKMNYSPTLGGRPRVGTSFPVLPAHGGSEPEAARIADHVEQAPLAPGWRPQAAPAASVEPPLAHARVEGGAGNSGQPLPLGTRALMESRFGRDFSQVRVHADAESAQSAAGVSAKAFTLGKDIVFGRGEYRPDTGAGRRLIAHELVHTVQQQAGAAAPALQRDVVDDVRGKLSYSAFDWAITDAEALEALARLEALPPDQLTRAVTALGPKYVTRLLDNLPDAAKTGPAYQRLIEALGPAAAVPYAKQQLNYAAFDWAITDSDVTQVFNIYANLPPAQQEVFLASLNDEQRLGRLIDNANSGHHALYIRPWINTVSRGSPTPRQRAILRVIADNSVDEVETLVLAAEVRFDVTVGPTTVPGRKAVPWDAAQLRRTYLALDTLPDAHVSKNDFFRRLGQFEAASEKLPTGEGTTTVAGKYNAGHKELAINVKAPADLESNIIHETGHAVDRELGWSTGTEPAKSARGGWKMYGSDYDLCARDMVDDSAGGIKTRLTASQRSEVEGLMGAAMGQRKADALEREIRALPWFGAIPRPDQRQVVRDRALTALEIGLQQPWFTQKDEGGGEHLGTHVYQEAYTKDWCRYEHQARDRILTPYQFREAPEWFAEAYAHFFSVDPDLREKLRTKDANTHSYFRDTVATLAPSR